MRLSSDELRTLAGEFLDDPHGENFPPERLNPLLDLAYGELANESDLIPRPWNGQPAASQTMITVQEGTREYSLGADPIRSVIDVHHLVGSTGYQQVRIVPYVDRFKSGQGNGVYVFRSAGDGTWFLGLVSLSSGYGTLAVQVRPKLNSLNPRNTGDVVYPVAVPEEFHELIAIKAALWGTKNEKRDASHLEFEYARGLDRMKRSGSSMSSTMSAGVW